MEAAAGRLRELGEKPEAAALSDVGAIVALLEVIRFFPSEFCGRKGGRDENRPAEGSDAEDDTAGNGLPMANLVRLMRQVIPTKARISARAKQLTHDCAIEFVGFVGGEASERAMAQHRRTIAPEDFTWSFRRLGLDNYVDPLTTYIRRYRDYQNAGGASSILAPRPPPRAAPGAPCFTDEEMQFLRSVVPPLHQGYDAAVSSSMHVPPPVAHGYGYTGYM
ncbi:nuclear transcription factor Y subunit B-1-like [Phragmites australis]|uniref:nuclear transcription factor Y subunit B-1-like n=1 Tax=Phragmites australis TaxID=29695 RepID=UPI002D78265A|nr:nuclear transcription factor Y subunit B-1-like [Phragmites australis]